MILRSPGSCYRLVLSQPGIWYLSRKRRRKRFEKIASRFKKWLAHKGRRLKNYLWNWWSSSVEKEPRNPDFYTKPAKKWPQSLDTREI